MPVILDSDYQIPSPMFENSYLQTMFAKLFRPIKKIKYVRERIKTYDDDFLDLDFSLVGSRSIAIVCHGLDGNSRRRYMLGIVKALNENNIDALAVNNRGCSGEPNGGYFLELGESEDLEMVVAYVLNTKQYDNVFLVGCSTGGNLVLKYLGEKGGSLDKKITRAYVISPTVDLESTVDKLHSFDNTISLKAFLVMLCSRLWSMRKTWYKKIRLIDVLSVKSFKDFYDKFICPRYQISFKEYLNNNSSWDLLANIKVPILMIYSNDDPFVDHRFYPYRQAEENPNLHMVMTRYGGHVGFVDFGKQYYWSERKMLEFLTNPIILKNSQYVDSK